MEKKVDFKEHDHKFPLRKDSKKSPDFEALDKQFPVINPPQQK